MTPFSSTPEMWNLSPDGKFLKAMGVTPAGLAPDSVVKQSLTTPTSFLDWPIAAQNRLVAALQEPMTTEELEQHCDFLQNRLNRAERREQRWKLLFHRRKADVRVAEIEAAEWKRVAKVETAFSRKMLDQRDELSVKLNRARWYIAALGVGLAFALMGLFVEWTNR